MLYQLVKSRVTSNQVHECQFYKSLPLKMANLNHFTSAEKDRSKQTTKINSGLTDITDNQCLSVPYKNAYVMKNEYGHRHVSADIMTTRLNNDAILIAPIRSS